MRISTFANEKALVKPLCYLWFLTDDIKPELIEINKTSVLVYNNDLLKLGCESVNDTRVQFLPFNQAIPLFHF